MRITIYVTRKSIEILFNIHVSEKHVLAIASKLVSAKFDINCFSCLVGSFSVKLSLPIKTRAKTKTFKIEESELPI